MEPRNNLNTMGPATPESASASIDNNFESPGNFSTDPEVTFNSPEQARSAKQVSQNNSDDQPMNPPPKPISVQDKTTTNIVKKTTPVQNDNPSTATDSNIIEKEWIDKVKKVINSTAEDPYVQQNEINLLMADYILKRTGRKIGKDGGQ